MTVSTAMSPRQSSDVLEEIAEAIGRIRFGSVLIQIQDGVVVQIEATEKKRFSATLPTRAHAR